MVEIAENEKLNEREFSEGKLVLESFPTVISLGLTLKCNLRCVMCPTRTIGNTDMSDEIIEKVEPYLKYCRLTGWDVGGELMASPRVEKYFDLIKRTGSPESSIETNFQLADKYMDRIFDSG